MATRSQIGRLAQRIDALAASVTPPWQAPECWVVERDRAWQQNDPKTVISTAELAARPTVGVRILMTCVHAKDGRPADCCQPGGACKLAQEML